jgi:hypothetical protein
LEDDVCVVANVFNKWRVDDSLEDDDLLAGIHSDVLEDFSAEQPDRNTDDIYRIIPSIHGTFNAQVEVCNSHLDGGIGGSQEAVANRQVDTVNEIMNAQSMVPAGQADHRIGNAQGLVMENANDIVDTKGILDVGHSDDGNGNAQDIDMENVNDIGNAQGMDDTGHLDDGSGNAQGVVMENVNAHLRKLKIVKKIWLALHIISFFI